MSVSRSQLCLELDGVGVVTLNGGKYGFVSVIGMPRGDTMLAGSVGLQGAEARLIKIKTPQK